MKWSEFVGEQRACDDGSQHLRFFPPSVSKSIDYRVRHCFIRFVLFSVKRSHALNDSNLY